MLFPEVPAFGSRRQREEMHTETSRRRCLRGELSDPPASRRRWGGTPPGPQCVVSAQVGARGWSLRSAGRRGRITCDCLRPAPYWQHWRAMLVAKIKPQRAGPPWGRHRSRRAIGLCRPGPVRPMRTPPGPCGPPGRPALLLVPSAASGWGPEGLRGHVQPASEGQHPRSRHRRLWREARRPRGRPVPPLFSSVRPAWPGSW